MKRVICLCLMLTIVILSGCSMEPVIPATGETFSYYFENQELFSQAVATLSEIDFDALISKTEYYAPDGSENFTSCYLQNMDDLSYTSYDEETVVQLFANCNVKMIDVIYRGDLTVCSFDMCIPGKSYDYGIYYTSGNMPIYLGDPAAVLGESENGYVYEQSASYGTKFTYYTEKLSENFYYYEIT